jgi:hypothetical protein
MKVRITALIGLVFAGLLVTTPWNAAAHNSPPPPARTPARTPTPTPAPPHAGAPTTVQDFQDVPTASTFLTYIHNLFVDGVVGGYPCGGAGEPCGPDNLPLYTSLGLCPTAASSRRN